MDFKCPGQNTLFWKPEDIFETPCPVCDHPVEFFRDDVTRKCPNCGYEFKNPKLDLGCAEWCPFADKCMAAMGKELPGQEESGPEGSDEAPTGG